MEIFHFAVDHNLLGTLALSASVIFAAIEITHLVKSQRVGNHIAINREHREIWSQYLTTPTVARVLDPNADVNTTPISREETLFVTFLILHLNTAFQAAKAHMFVAPEGLRQDIKHFFSHPVPGAVWKKARQFQDVDFVQFVEEAIEK